jgi:hypothetical protein
MVAIMVLQHHGVRHCQGKQSASRHHQDGNGNVPVNNIRLLFLTTSTSSGHHDDASGCSIHMRQPGEATTQVSIGIHGHSHHPAAFATF